uniref:Uncharacterized protein n=1 Tax=Globisporangium ultimum (strain ATCC 200006 / CBS 805.95 / DAOM BR144) TaxID=431595 RepID=K3WDH6_GLOUD
MARKVWFELVTGGSELFAGISATSVRLNDEVVDIEDCSSNKVHAQYNGARPPGTNVLAHIGPSQLRIHANRAAYDDAKKRGGEEAYLRPSAPLGGLGRDAKDALIVGMQAAKRCRLQTV